MSSESLSTQRTVNHEVMWRYMLRLLDRVFGGMDGESIADDCLDVLVDLLGADRGLILQTMSDGGARIVNARGHKKALTAEEREEVSRSIVRRALDARECVVWDPLAAASASASLSSLGIVAALAAPLFAHRDRGAPRGVLYVDFRDRRKLVDARHVEFFSASAALFGAVLEQHERGARVRDHLREAEAHCTEVKPVPPLDDLLGFPSMREIRREVDAALTGQAPILILGESGTGKTLLARSIAEASGLRPIVRAVLGSSDDLNTITSELFGHERGAYSGAAARRTGLVEFAHGGTILLDEIASLPAHAQQLLR